MRSSIVRQDFKDEFDLSFEEWFELIVKENVGHSRGREHEAQKLKNLRVFDIFTVP